MDEKFKDSLIDALELTDAQRKSLVNLIYYKETIYYSTEFGGCSELWIEEDLEEFPEQDRSNLASVDFDEEDWLETAISYAEYS